jgi:hypothetical protein
MLKATANPKPIHQTAGDWNEEGKNREEAHY